MLTLGIDLSSMPDHTSACCIRWQEGRAVAAEPIERCTDQTLDALIQDADATGIDAPFGWPSAFTNAVHDWSEKTWTAETRDRLKYRLTDLAVHEQQRRWPLSVSSDLIALPAMRAMALLLRHGVTDRSGDGHFFEVYPAASLHAWGLPNRRYKGKKPPCAKIRGEILAGLRGNLPWLEVPDSCAATDDSLDALVAALTCRVATQGNTVRPQHEQMDAARREGWIHIPTTLPHL